MISKRNFFSITLMMLILFFLFQFSMMMRDGENAYDENTNLVVRQADGENVWKQEETDLKSMAKADREYVLFIGNENQDMETAVSRWCVYTKRNFCSYPSLDQYPKNTEKDPEVILLESEEYATGKNLEWLRSYVEQGGILIFGELCDAAKIKENQDLMDLLGIKSVVTEKVELSGMKLFEGLLLGGEVVYQPTTKKEREERMDLDFSVPWYQVGSGTKTYMVGLLKEEEMEKKKIENQDLPTLIWRNGIEGGSVYAVCGDYMKDSTATGLLDGMVSEASEYTIYPIVNAQNLSMVNFPEFANENNEKMMEMYSRPVSAITRDIMWPAMVSIAEQSKLKMTCFIQPQFDYLDDIEPDNEEMIFFLKQLKEQNAEAGISLQYKRASSMSDKITSDGAFFASVDSNYKYGAAYVDEDQLSLVLNMQDTQLLKDVGTLVCDYTEDQPLVSYCGSSITLQTVTNSGMKYTYSDDLRMRSIQSSLGYTNVMLNMEDIIWPQDEQDSWQIVQERFSSNLMTYWKKFSYFSETTASESNARARTFLNLDYSSQQKEDNQIVLQTSETGSWFVFRTHGKEIENVEGGAYKKLEENVYLINAEETEVTINLRGEALHYMS